MKTRRYFLWPLGCAQNMSDAERVATVLEQVGFQITSEESEADLICVLACSVRQSAIDRIYGRNKIWSSQGGRKYKKKSLKILSGCVLPKDKKKMSLIFDLIFDIQDLQKLPGLVNSKPASTDSGGQITDNKKSAVIPAEAGIQKKKIKQLDPRVKPEDDKLVDSGPAYAKSFGTDSQARMTGKEHFNYLSINPKRSNDFQALVPISNGCNNFCSYCAVPYTRGREVSRPMEEIIEECKNLIKSGYKEITLLGQNVNSYKINNQSFDSAQDKHLTINNVVIPAKAGIQTKKARHLDPRIKSEDDSHLERGKESQVEKSDFQILLEELNKIPGKFWIRFISNHPKDFSESLIKKVSMFEKVTPYIHLPLQSGSDKILKAMNRKYTREDYLKLVEKIRKHIPNVAISTDTIVGFPGETEEDFKRTLDLFKKVSFDMAYIAQYSPRSGTLAARLKDNVAKEEKKRREKELTKVLSETALKNNKKYIGKTVEVLVEKHYKKYLWGRTDTYKLVKFAKGQSLSKNRCDLIGKFVSIKIKSATPWLIEGNLQ